MVELAPEDCITLVEFYERFTAWMWNGGSPVEELQLDRRIAKLPGERVLAHRAAFAQLSDRLLSAAVRLFGRGRLTGRIVEPLHAKERGLSTRAWEQAFFPERMFLSDTIQAGHGPEFDAAEGRTPFVRTVVVDDVFRELAHSEYRSDLRWVLRECLLGLVMDGVLLEGEAESFAKRWGLPPFESHPPRSKFKPTKLAVWSLPMAVSWIVWRDYVQVREAMDEYRAECWEWFGVQRRLPVAGGTDWYDVDGSELRTLEPMTLFLLGSLEALDMQSARQRIEMSVKSAREQLWSKLTENALIATGIDSTGEIVSIPSREWAYIALNSDANFKDRLAFLSTAKPAYSEVRFLRTDLVALWPPRPNDAVEQFDVQAKDWTLLEAATWVGCRGVPTTSQDIIDDNLEEEGAHELFAMLGRAEGLVATGLNRKRIREAIPSEYWELATLDPDLSRERHYVSFIDEVLRDYGGVLTPYGHRDPAWFGIKVNRRELFESFHHLLPAGRQSSSSKSEVVRPRKLSAACEAIQAVFPRGIPKGLSDKERRDKINAWLTSHGHSQVSLSTIARANALL